MACIRWEMVQNYFFFKINQGMVLGFVFSIKIFGVLRGFCPILSPGGTVTGCNSLLFGTHGKHSTCLTKWVWESRVLFLLNWVCILSGENRTQRFLYLFKTLFEFIWMLRPVLTVAFYFLSLMFFIQLLSFSLYFLTKVELTN